VTGRRSNQLNYNPAGPLRVEDPHGAFRAAAE
jgi:hypothetical protein